MSGKPESYRFIGRNGFRTRWRPWPKDSFPKPSKVAAQKLGVGYGIRIRSPAKRKAS